MGTFAVNFQFNGNCSALRFFFVLLNNTYKKKKKEMKTYDQMPFFLAGGRVQSQTVCLFNRSSHLRQSFLLMLH